MTKKYCSTSVLRWPLYRKKERKKESYVHFNLKKSTPGTKCMYFNRKTRKHIRLAQVFIMHFFIEFN